MEDTGPRDSSMINHVYSSHTILNIKFGVNRMFHVLKTPTTMTTMAGTGLCESMRIIFGSIV